MKAKGVRLHAANDLSLEEFELPEITDDEILVKVVSDSICMSTYKCAILGIMLCSGICCCNTVQCYSRKRWMRFAAVSSRDTIMSAVFPPVVPIT